MPQLAILAVGALALAVPLSITFGTLVAMLTPDHAALGLMIPAAVLTALLGLYARCQFDDGVADDRLADHGLAVQPPLR